MRIGLVVPDLRDPGGIPAEARLVARSLRRELGADIRIVSMATSSSDASSRLLRRPGTWLRHPIGSYTHEEFTVEHVGATGADIELARYRQRRGLLDRVAGCDVLHVLSGTPAFGHAVRGFRGPLIVHFASFARHERSDPSPASASLLGSWRRLMTKGVTAIERAALRRADLIIAMNDTRRREAEAIVAGAVPVTTVHTGVDTDRFSPGPYQSDGYLLAVGRLSDPRKNIPLLLRAYAAARQQSTTLPRLVLAGFRPPSAESWQLVAELGIADYVEYRGAVEPALLNDLYRGAAAFVLSSDEEGLGIVILEAMASGLPIVATSCIGPTETVTNDSEGLLVPVGSVSHLTNALVRISADDALRRRLSQAARARAVREFALEPAAARLGAAYRDHGLVPAVPVAAASSGHPAGHPARAT
jgi:glycosyltransferase involved in cell wall biosynthesis